MPVDLVYRYRERLLARLSLAYQVGASLSDPFVYGLTRQRAHTGGELSRDDPVLYAHWYGTPMPSSLASLTRVETRLWDELGRRLESMPDPALASVAYTGRARRYAPLVDALEGTLHGLLVAARHPTADSTVAERLECTIDLLPDS